MQHIQNRAWKFIDGHDQLIQEVMQSNALLQLFEQRKAELLAAFVETEQRMTVPQSYAELLRRCWLPDVEIVVPRQAPTQVGHVELLFREPRRQLAQFFRESLQRYCAVGVTTYDQQKHNLSSSYATHRVVDLKQAYRGAYYVDVPALRAGGGSFWRKPSGKTEAQSLGVRWSHCFPRRFLVELTGLLLCYFFWRFLHSMSRRFGSYYLSFYSLCVCQSHAMPCFRLLYSTKERPSVVDGEACASGEST